MPTATSPSPGGQARLGWNVGAAMLVICLGVLASACAAVPEGRRVVDVVDVRAVDARSRPTSAAVDTNDVEEHLATTPSPKFLGLFRGVVYDYVAFDQHTLDRDLERAERYYRARGYYDAKARAAQVISPSTDHVRVVIDIDEGQPVLVSTVKLVGDEALPDDVRAIASRTATRAMKLARPFDEDLYVKAEATLRRALTDRGYAYAKVTRTADVDVARRTADVTFTLDPGPRCQLGEITIEGLGNLPEEPVRRALDLAPGDPYSTSDLDDAKTSVLDLGVFANVSLRPDLSKPTDPAASTPPRIPLVVHVELSKLRKLKVGGGVELDLIRTDVHAIFGWEHDDFLGGFRRLTITLQPALVLYPTRLPGLQKPEHLLAGGKSRIELSQPGFLEARTRGTLRAEYNIYPVLLSPDIDPAASVLGYRELRSSISVDRTWWKVFGQLGYNFQVNIPFAYLGPLDPTLSGVTISYIDVRLQLDLRNDKVEPHKGFLLSNDLQLAGGPLRGDARDLRTQPEARVYLPTSRRTTLALRGTLGFLFPFNYGSTLTNAPGGLEPAGVDRAAWVDDVQLVYFRAFFSGGANSNRGYPLRGVGPHGTIPFFNPTLAASALAQSCDPKSPDYVSARCAQPRGGATLWELSVEFRFPVQGDLASAVFCDASDVSAEKVDLRFYRLHLSCGSGIRYATPVGPIRADIGYRIPGMQILGSPDSAVEGNPGSIFGAPIAISLGIGEAF